MHTQSYSFLHPPQSNLKKRLQFVSFILITIALISFLVLTWTGGWVRIQGNEMQPNWIDGQWAWLEKDASPYIPGDVVVIETSTQDYVIRRIIGVYPDYIAYKKGRIWRNGQWTSTLFQKEFLDPSLPMNTPILTQEQSKTSSYPIYVPPFKINDHLDLNLFQVKEDEVFVLCDHRMVCQDPIGSISLHQIQGRLLKSHLF